MLAPNKEKTEKNQKKLLRSVGYLSVVFGNASKAVYRTLPRKGGWLTDAKLTSQTLLSGLRKTFAKVDK